MKDVKKTKVPLPGAKPNRKPQSAPPKAQLSQETIDTDSDSASESMARPKKIEKPKATIGIHVNGVPKSKTNSSKTDADASNSASKPKPSPKKPASKQIVTERDVADLSSSEVSDDDAPARDIQTKLPGNEEKKDVSSDTESESESENTSSSESSSDESDTDDAPQPKRNPAPSQPQTQVPTQSHTVEFQPTRAFVPPKGFNPVPLNDKTISRSSTGLFENLEGKQVWHITAPAGVSLRDLKELAMKKVNDGEVVLSHKGNDFGFSQMNKSEAGTRQIFVPRKDDMKPVPVPITQSLRLRRIMQLPKLSSLQADQNTGSEAAASITRSTIRAPRPQVKGLKMRFLPTGFTGNDPGTIGDSDDELEPARETAVLGMPEPSKSSKKQKRKHADVNGTETSEAPMKKSKKHQDSEEAKRKAEKKAKKEKKRAKEAASVGS
ncbi:DNA-directed RNA polymerase I subunit RPA34.5-domain-containing protein [Bipolaris maydis]|nr:DNA-directed RNA polymerase I subunit RPA34.5-domain-containing protein [Bipolaris maydis]